MIPIMFGIIVLCGLLYVVFRSEVGKTYTAKEFVDRLYPIARQVEKSYGIKAELLMVQASVESNYGNSQLTKTGNNLFGMTYTGTGGFIELPTKEYVNGSWVTVSRKFRVYGGWGDSVMDWVKLMTGSRYRNVYNALVVGNVNNWASALVLSGYATDPSYEQVILRRYEAMKKYFQ